MAGKMASIVRAIAFVVLSAGPALASPGVADPTRAPTPTDHSRSDALQAADCLWPGGADAAEHGIDCWTLTVSERHEAPDGRTIELAVAILHSRSANPAPDPVLFLAGGPGQSALLGIAEMWAASSIRDDRDLILFDQRGSGYSRPSLQCPETQYAAYAPFATLEEAVEAQVRQAMACHDRLIAAGIDLTAYDAVQSARDVQMLRTAMGYDQWNLYGISYGTRLALEVMRRDGQGVRSAVLDSVYPPDVDPTGTVGARFERSLDAVLAACSADAACAAAYPDAPDGFTSALSAPDGPVVERSDPVLGHHVVTALSNLLYDPEGIAVLPALGQGLAHGADAPFRIPPIPPIPPISFPEADAEGLFYATECRERVAFSDQAKIAADRTAHPRFGAQLAAAILLGICARWDLPALDPAGHQPVSSDVPTVLLSGTFDPVTPPDWARHALETLPNGQLVTFADASHWITRSPCGIEVRIAFLANPFADASPPCATDSKPFFATDIVVAPGLEYLRTQLDNNGNGPTIGNWIVFAAILLGFLAALVRWPRELRRGTHRRWSVPWVVRVLGLVAIAADVTFLVGLAAFVALEPEDSVAAAIGINTTFAWILPAAIIGAGLSLGAVIGAIVALAARSRPVRADLATALIAVAVAGFSATLVHYGVIFG